MSKKRKQQTEYEALGFFIGFFSNAMAGMLAIFFGISGALFYARKLDIIDLGAVLIGVALMGGAGYFAYKMTKTMKA